MRNAVIQSTIAGQAFVLCPMAMDSLLEFANSDTPRAASVSEIANNSVTYEKQNSVAIISVDGGMYKKDIGGMCSSVASYDQMVKYINKAEADSEVATILFRVDTPGGSVAGADEVGDKIFNSKKRTVCLYENVGASGGIWIFSACNELYATESTVLGSVGVIVSYMESTTDTGMKRVSIVSKNAENKDCSLNGDCKNKIQEKLDTYESMFFARIERNTGFTMEQVKTTFNNGDVIFASAAKDAGFIKDVTTFDALLDNLKSGSGASPTVSAKADNKSDKLNQGAVMAKDKTLLGTLQALVGIESSHSEEETLAELQDALTAANATLASQTEALNVVNATLATQTEAMAALELRVAEAEKFKAETATRLLEAKQVGVSMEVAIAMVNAETPEEASQLAIAAKASTGGTPQGEGVTAAMVESAEIAYAKAFANTISVKG